MFIVPGILIIALILTLWPWLGIVPQLHRIPIQLIVMGIVWVTLIGIRRLRMPRWSLPVATGILAFGFLAIAEHFPLSMLFVSIFAISTLLLLVSMAVGRIAAHSVSRRDSDVAMAIFAGYVIGQFMPFLY